MSLPPISGERSGIPRRGQQPRQTKRQINPANAPYTSPESFDDSVSNTGASSTITAATAAAAAAALDRRDASDFRIVVAARIRPFTAREVQQWRRERRAVESPEDVEEARRARAALRQPFGPGHKSLNATQGGLDSTWTRRHDNEEDNTNANGQHGAFDASDVPQPVVEVESDGTTIALLDPQSVTQDGVLAPAVRNAFTYDYVYSSFAPNVVLDTQCGPAGRHGNNNSGGNNGAPSPYVILEGDDEGASASERQTSSRHTPAQELQAEAEQVAIYEQLAIPLVDAAMRGYNTCMFAYGQTGSGKTYTMMGTPRHPGLIPRLCRRLFSEITTRNEEGGGLNSTASATSPALVTLQLSYMEIYNEQVRDLLKQRPKNAILHYKSRFDKKDVDSDEYRTLKVRHHPSKGIYVDGLTSVPVRTWDECEAYLQAGNALRTQCSTAMNAKSSRSHAIFQLQMTQRESTGGRVRGREVALETFSKINLVDLAGSERNTQSKTTGKHLAEANSINASLSTLRRVLDGLIANRAAALSGGSGAGGKGKKSAVVIPYRESLLTYVLSDNLGGNSFTVMCANVSPCASSAGETESTLRYATLAKAVVNHAKLNEAPTARVIREMRDQLRVMQEALRSAPDPSHVAALEEGVQLSEALLREMKTREGDYEAQLQAQAEEAAALQEAVEAHRRQETYWRDEARRQQREVEELREALFEATQNGAQSSGVHLPSLTDPRGAAGAGAGAAASKKRSKSQQQQQQSPAKKRRGSSLAVEPVSSPSSSGAAAAAALAAVSARDGRASRARATPLSLLGDARTKSKKRPSLSTLPEAPASAPDKARRASLDSGPVVASAPSSGEARALAGRTRVNGVMGRPPLSTKSYGDVNDDDVDGTAAADNDFVERETGKGDVPAFYHTEHFLAVAASDDYTDDHAPAAGAAVVPHNAPPHSTYEQLDFTQLQEEALRVGGTSGTFEGGLEIEGVAATPSRRQWPTSSPRVAAARTSQAASDRRRSSTTAAATARQQNTKNKKMKLKKKTGKGGAAAKEGGASRGVSEERAGTEENEGWPPGETSTSFELPSAPAAAASVSASAHAAHAAHHVKSNAVHDTSPLSPHTPHGEEGLTEMHSANPEDQLGGEEEPRRQQRMLSGSSSADGGGGSVARGAAKVPHHDTDEGDEYEEDYWNAQELTGEEMFADDVDSAAASLNPSSALAANAMPSLHKTTRKTKAGGASHLNTGASAGARHYSTVDTLH